MPRAADRLALLFSLIAVLAAVWVSDRYFEQVPHIEDEMAFTWQAETISHGDLTIRSPYCPTCFMVPFVVDYNGQRFGKYPPGWPVVLSFGVRAGARWLVNPLLAGLAIWLTYRLVQKICDEKTALLAAFLTLTSPFFWMNAGSLLSHVWSLVLTLIMAIAWFDAVRPNFALPRWIPTLTAGLAIGLLALTRPLTAIGVSLPFFVHGLYLLIRSNKDTRLRILTVGLIAAAVAGLLFVWQYAVTGNPLQNPYVLWWPYDKVGFGPGFGLHPSGHNIHYALVNTEFSLGAGESDLFGWGIFSWLFVPFGLFALRRKSSAWVVAFTVVTLVFVYGLYWIGSWLFGPRYYFEGLISMTLLSAAGIRWLAGSPRQSIEAGQSKRAVLARWGAVVFVVVLLVGVNLRYYLPIRLNSMVDLYGVSAKQMAPFKTPEAQRDLTPALVIVHIRQSWTEYGGLLDMSDPYLTSPFIFAASRGNEVNEDMVKHFPGRKVWHYYPSQQPDTLFTLPRPGEIEIYP